MRNLIALIPTTGVRDINAMQNWLNASGEVDHVELYLNEVPVGISNARRALVLSAFNKYGSDAIYLMLDDDCEFTAKSKLRDAAAYFDEMDKLGIVCLPIDFDACKDSYRDMARAHHCFMFSGEVVDAGINYHENEFCDEQDFSAQVYLAGYNIILTYRAAIMHHYSTDADKSGVNYTLLQNGVIPMQSHFIENYSDYYNFSTRLKFGVEIPVVSTITPNMHGKDIHSKNRQLLLNQ